MNFEELSRHCDVSRETYEKLAAFVALLQKWQKRINLIAPSTQQYIWERHILDSLLLATPITTQEPKAVHFVDLGSGAGFPALPVAAATGMSAILLESDSRKAVFLEEAIRVLRLSNVQVLNQRIEKVSIAQTPFITARACASLTQLLAWSVPLLSPDGKCLFHKGRQYRKEIEEASVDWQFSHDIMPSPYDPDAAIVTVSHIQRRV